MIVRISMVLLTATTNLRNVPMWLLLIVKILCARAAARYLVIKPRNQSIKSSVSFMMS